MKLFIPDVGEELTLVDDWRFVTICEYRNESLFNAFEVPAELRYQKSVRFHGGAHDGYDRYRPLGDGVPFVMPAGTVLKVDRVYIRKGISDYSSLTFLVSQSPDKRLLTKKNGGTAPKAVRFWVKLAETRNIEIEG